MTCNGHFDIYLKEGFIEKHWNLQTFGKEYDRR